MTERKSNEVGISDLIGLALHIHDLPVNAATTFAVRQLLRRATEKACPVRKGSNAGGGLARYWSAAARSAPPEDREVDHLIPQSELIASVARMEDRSPTEVRSLVDRHTLTACVIKAEHKRLLTKKMPADWCGKDPFARYKLAGIQLFNNDDTPAW